jgi:DNA polymerase I
MDSLESLLALAKSGHFAQTPVKRAVRPLVAANDDTATDALPPAPTAQDAILTRHWRIDFVDRPDMAPFRITFVEPWTRPGLLANAHNKRPDLPAPDLRPLPPDFETETLQQLNLALSHTAPIPPAMVAVSTGKSADAAHLNAAANSAIAEKPETEPARVILDRAGVTVALVDTPEQAAVAVAGLLALSDTGEPWGLDIETMPRPEWKTDKKAGLDPYKSAIRLVQVFPGGATCFVFDVAALGLSCLEPLWARAMVAHNAVFELKHLLHAGANPARLGCTLLMGNARNGNRPSLADLTADVLNWQLDKTAQTSNWGGDLSPAQLDYAALDAVAAFTLAQTLIPDLERAGRGRGYALMRDAQKAIARLELAGCPFDADAHRAQMATWQATAETARGELDGLLGVNPDSPAQLAGWLKANLPPEALKDWPKTNGGSLATDADTLSSLTLPALEPLARYKQARKLLSTYGTSYAAHLHPLTGRIHPSFVLGGAATGRLACRSPNIQNPPRGADFRALFAPTGGRVFVVADYSQVELRVAALVSGDSAMLAAYDAGEDLHRKTAAAVLKKAPGEVTKSERQMAKAINFGLLFGSGAAGLQRYATTAYGVSMSLAEAKRARSAFFAAYPGFAKWQTATREAAERAQQVRTPGGRVRNLEGTRSLQTECLNTPIQGGAAECLLVALATLEPLLDGLGADLCNVIHDELVVECDPERAADVMAAVEAAMVAGFLAIFPTGATRDLVEAHSGANWAAAKG